MSYYISNNKTIRKFDKKIIEMRCDLHKNVELGWSIMLRKFQCQWHAARHATCFGLLIIGRGTDKRAHTTKSWLQRRPFSSSLRTQTDMTKKRVELSGWSMTKTIWRRDTDAKCTSLGYRKSVFVLFCETELNWYSAKTSCIRCGTVATLRQLFVR